MDIFYLFGYKYSKDKSINIKMSYLCEYCDHPYTTKNHLTRHQNTDKCKYIKGLLDKRDKINEEKNNIIQKENERLKLQNNTK